MKRSIVKLAVILIVFVILSACGDAKTDESQEPAPGHFYDNAEIKPVMNGDRSEKLGEYSVASVLSEEMTEDALEDWYFNYVAEHNYNWCMILYADKKNSGVYAISGMVQVDVKFDVDEYGDFSVGDSSGAKFYGPSDGKLVALWQDEKSSETEEPKIAEEMDDLIVDADALKEIQPVFPMSSLSVYYLNAKPLPEIVFTTTGGENGLGGMPYRFSGTVTDRFLMDVDGIGVESFYIETELGTLVVNDFVGYMYKAYPEYAHELYEKDQTDYTYPEVGDTAEFICTYSGWSELYDMPNFYYGADEEVVLTTWADWHPDGDKFPDIIEEKTEYTLDELADLMEETLNQEQENLQYRVVAEADELSIVLALKQLDYTADEIAEMFASNEIRWEEMQNSVFTIYNAAVDCCSDFGFSDITVNVLFVSDADVNEVYFAILDGDIVLDCVNDS